MKGIKLLIFNILFLSLIGYAQTSKPIKVYDSTINKQYPEHETIIGDPNKINKKSINKQRSLKSNKSYSSIKSINSNNLSDLIINKIVYSNENKLPIFISTTLNKTAVTDTIKSNSNKIELSLDNLLNISDQYLNQLKPYLIRDNFTPTFKYTSLTNDEQGYSHLKYNQTINNIPIYGSEIIIHINNKGEAQIFNGKYVNASVVDNRISYISESKVIEIIDKYYDDNKIKKSKFNIPFAQQNTIDTTYYINKNQLAILAFHVISYPNPIRRYEHFINAATGEILESIETTCSFAGPATINATDLNGNSKTINSYFNGSKYYLRDVSKPMFNATTTSPSGYIETFNALNTSSDNFEFEYITSNTNSWADAKSVSAHSNASISYDYYLKNHSRNSINGNGANIYSFINVADDSTGIGMDNAYWNGFAMYYGNGNKIFKPLAASLDVAGHEMTHGVVQASANLEYSGQSGALNESFADIFGALIDSTNWTIGEGIILSTALKYYPSGSLRSLQDPHNGGKSISDNSFQPNNMKEFFYGNSDNYGVHINSGIPNFAFYLLATSPIGKANAGKIYYRALNNYLTKKSLFLDLRVAVIQAAKDLFSNLNADKYAATAFDSVGIYEATTTSSASKTIPTNIGTEYLITLNTDVANTNGIYRSNQQGLNYTALAGKVMGNKMSITDNGNNGVYVGVDKKLYLIKTNPTSAPTISVMQNQAIWSSVAFSKDGKRLAAVTTSADTSIWVYDFNKIKWFRYKLYAPTYSNVKAQGPVYADALEWDYNGEYLVYDCYNKIGSATTSSIDYWDINAIHVWDNDYDTTGTGDIVNFFSLGENDNIGNPVIAKNSPNIMAFDYFNTVNKEYITAGYNLEKDSLDLIYTNNTIGYPSYSRLDDSLYIVSLDSRNVSSINKIKLNANKISSSSVPIKILSSAKWPISYTTGTRYFVTPPKPRISLNSNSVICSTNKISLTSSNGIGNQWYFNGVLIKDSTRRTLVTNSAGSYSVISATGELVSEFSDPVVINVLTSPSSPKVKDTSYCLNQSVINLSASLNATNDKLRWYGFNAVGGSFDSLAPKPFSNAVAVYNYYVSEFNNASGCESNRSKITISVNALPLAPTVTDSSFCNNVSADSLKVKASSGNSLLWYGTNATGGTGATIASKPTTSTIGNYNYYVSQSINVTGCEGPRSKIIITIKPVPSAPVLIRDTANYLLASTNSNIWYKDGVQLGDTAQRIKPAAVGSYSAKTTLNGCVSVASSNYYFLVTDVINLSGDEFIKLAPNPFSNQLNFDFVVKGYQRLNVDFFEIATGTKVDSKQGLLPGVPMYLGHLSAGTYLVKVSSGDGKITHSFKIMKL